jgi:hypothetical protein
VLSPIRGNLFATAFYQTKWGRCFFTSPKLKGKGDSVPQLLIRTRDEGVELVRKLPVAKAKSKDELVLSLVRS